jgi:hypothetical protein
MGPRNDEQIVVLGTDPHIVNACHERGLTGVVVRDVRAHLRGDNALPPGFTEAVIADVSDVGDVMAGLMRRGDGRLPGGLRGVVTTNEYAVASAAWLSKELNLTGPSLEGVVRMRDKHLQKEAVRAAGLPTAASRVTVAGSHERQLPYPGPCVVKPSAGAGTEHTYKCRSEAEYLALMDSLATRVTSPLVVEDLVDVGEEWLVDGVVQNGAVVFASLARYGEPLLDYTSGSDVGVGRNVLRIFRLDGAADDNICATARDLAARSLKALGYEDGVFHLELLRDRRSGEFLFGECAARRGGAMVQEEVALRHGFSLAGAAVDIALGRPVRAPGAAYDRCVGSTHLHLPPGTILHVAGREDLQELGFVHDVHVSALVGPNVPPSVMTTSYRQGMCVVSGGSLDELEQNMDEARRRFRDRSVVAPTGRPPADVRAFMARQRQSSS